MNSVHWNTLSTPQSWPKVACLLQFWFRSSAAFPVARSLGAIVQNSFGKAHVNFRFEQMRTISLRQSKQKAQNAHYLEFFAIISLFSIALLYHYHFSLVFIRFLPNSLVISPPFTQSISINPIIIVIKLCLTLINCI